MEGVNSFVGFRFLGCEGFGIKQESSLAQIAEAVKDVYPEGAVVYLLDKKGNIKCTLLASKSEYENAANLDRRTANVANGFFVLWDRDGRCCTVFYHPKADGCGCSVLASILCLIIGLAIGWGVAYFAVRDSSGSSEPVSMKTDTVVVTKTDTVYLSKHEKYTKERQSPIQERLIGRDQENEEKEAIVNSFVSRYKGKLWSDQCSMETVEEVKEAWRAFPYKDEARNIYDFDAYIYRYETFFKGSMDAVSSLLAYRGVFSKDQYRVIRYYSYNSATYRKLRDTFGMTFTISKKDFDRLKK